MIDWSLEPISLFLTACAALIVYIAHRRTRVSTGLVTSAEHSDAVRHHRRLGIALGLIAASLVVHSAALIFLR